MNRQKNRKHPAEVYRKRRKQRILRNRILAVLFLFFLLFLGFRVFKSSLFTIQKITIRGNTKVESRVLKEASGLNKGKPLFQPSKAQLIGNLEKVPYVDKAKIKRTLTGKVEISVTEREPLAQIYYDEWYWLLDKDLRILEKTREFHPDLLKITGMNLRDKKPGQFLFSSEKERREREVFRFVLDSELTSYIRSAELSENSLNFVTKDDIKVVFGSFNNGIYKCKELVEVLKKVETMDKKVLMILMEKGEDPIAVTEGPAGMKPMSGNSGENTDEGQSGDTFKKEERKGSEKDEE